MLWPPHPRRALPQRVLAPQRHAQVQRLGEAGRLAHRLLHGDSIANGNRRVAVKYVPLMLQGTAHTWLNSLKPYSINSWLDFTEIFVRNFTSTYKRPPKPRQLSLCVQGPNESTRDYLTRWAELRNSCEGVHEVQAIEYFTAGCREGTLLKHRLLCDEPATLDELLITAEPSWSRGRSTISAKYCPAQSKTTRTTRRCAMGCTSLPRN